VRVDAKSSLALLRGEVTGVTIMASRVRLLDVSVGSSVLHRVATWCSVLQRVALYCNLFQCVAVCVAVYCSPRGVTIMVSCVRLLDDSVGDSVLHSVAVCCSM